MEGKFDIEIDNPNFKEVIICLKAKFLFWIIPIIFRKNIYKREVLYSKIIIKTYKSLNYGINGDTKK